jgi:hypothetical protein
MTGDSRAWNLADVEAADWGCPETPLDEAEFRETPCKIKESDIQLAIAYVKSNV